MRITLIFHIGSCHKCLVSVFMCLGINQASVCVSRCHFRVAKLKSRWLVVIVSLLFLSCCRHTLKYCSTHHKRIFTPAVEAAKKGLEIKCPQGKTGISHPSWSSFQFYTAAQESKHSFISLLAKSSNKLCLHLQKGEKDKCENRRCTSSCTPD